MKKLGLTILLILLILFIVPFWILSLPYTLIIKIHEAILNSIQLDIDK